MTQQTQQEAVPRVGRSAQSAPSGSRPAHELIAALNARLDRLPGWGLHPAVYAVLGMCYLLAFYDIAVIGVVLPRLADDMHLTGSQEALPITLNLIGYIVGAYALGNVADALGRRRTLAIVMTLLAASSLLTALSWNDVSLAAFRFIAGVAIGSQITLSATLIGEFAPATSRGRYLAKNIVWASVGNVIPAILAIPLLRIDGTAGWRILFAIPALVVFALVLFRDHILPESPRWLATHEHHARADRIVSAMEDRNRARTGGELPAPVEVPAEENAGGFPTSALFRRPFVGRLAVVFAFWFIFYFAVYAFLAYETTLLDDLDATLPSSVVITAIGFAGGILGAALQPLFIDRIERRTNVIAGLAVFLLGFVMLAVATGPALVVVGAFLASAGLFLSIIPAYAYTAEIFPTRARAAAMGVGDGLGHAGGAVQPYVVVPLLAAAGARSVFALLAAVTVAAALVMLFAIRTNRRALTELSQ